MKKTNPEKEFGIKSVEKALCLLNHILASQQEGISLTALAEKSSLSPATARNLLRTMEKSSHIQRTPKHLYKTGKALSCHFRKGLFTDEENLFLANQVKKLSLLCGETICLFGKDRIYFPEEENFHFFCITSHSGSRSIIAGEEAARNSISGPSAAGDLFLTRRNSGEKGEITEGKACKNALWSICLPLYGRSGECLAVLALFLPAGRAVKEKCCMLKEFLSTQHPCTLLEGFFTRFP
ncbi:MAG: helix-turn-helix domain-containing protein [Lentisphaeria bacterium]|nr:helix-turn-helix domain-containing protein [Lentisphaeria bacterium]